MHEYMNDYYELKEKLDRIAREINQSGPTISRGDLEVLRLAVSARDKIGDICMKEEDGGYSGDGEWMAGISGTYGRRNSYAGQRRNNMDNSYRGGSSYNGSGGREHIRDYTRREMERAKTPEAREAIQRFASEMERMSAY